MPAGHEPQPFEDPIEDKELRYRVRSVEMAIQEFKFRLNEIETSLFGNPEHSNPGLRKEMNENSERLKHVEQTTSSILLMVRLTTGLLGAIASGIWAIYSRGGFPFNGG